MLGLFSVDLQIILSFVLIFFPLISYKRRNMSRILMKVAFKEPS